jgi:hypothetical protein
MSRHARCTSQRPPAADAGFSLVEVIVAAGMLAALAAGLAQVFAISARANHVARVQTMGAVLAGQKMEQLRSLTWAHAPGGEPLSDVSTNLASDPPNASGDGLAAGPPGALDRDVPFHVDYLGAAGRLVPARDQAEYIRRWSATPLASDPDNLLLLQVRVVTAMGADSRLVTVMMRRP